MTFIYLFLLDGLVGALGRFCLSNQTEQPKSQQKNVRLPVQTPSCRAAGALDKTNRIDLDPNSVGWFVSGGKLPQAQVVATCPLNRTEQPSNQDSDFSSVWFRRCWQLATPNRKPANREWRARVSHIYALESTANKTAFFGDEPCQEQVKGHQSKLLSVWGGQFFRFLCLLWHAIERCG